MLAINILIVEDDNDQQQLYEDGISDYNEGNASKKISYDFVDSSSDAIRKLGEKNYDAVFLDLFLKGDHGDGSNASGNDVLRHVLDNTKLRLIVFVVSGTLNSLSDDLEGVFDNPLMRKFDRSEDTCSVLNELTHVLETGITKILGGSGELDRLINDIFFHHLSKGFELWVQKGRSCEKELLRYTAMHLLEYLDTPNPVAGKGINYFNPEFYIYPPIRQPISTGDIINLDNLKYVILSPSCDITPRVQEDNKTIFNVEVAVLAEIIPLVKTTFDDRGISYSSSGKKNPKAWERFATNQRGTSPKQRFHYLPDYLDIDEAVIDFKRIINKPICEVLDDQKVKRIATISSPFVRDVQSRFSAYFGRQGQPAGEWSV